MHFSDKVVIITGASSGIGAATAVHFAKLGASVVLVGRNAENLSKTSEECLAANSRAKVISVRADVTKDAKAIIDQTIARFGKLDVLVNNAAIMLPGDIQSAALEDFDIIMKTNVRSVYELTKFATPHLIKTKGNIVNVSSVAGIRSFPNALNYCISKAALDQFTKCTSLDLAPYKVRVNAVNPGSINTNILKRCGMSEEEYAAHLERCKGTHALGRAGEASEVTGAIVFLAGPEASFITGSLMSVDGGKINMCPR